MDPRIKIRKLREIKGTKLRGQANNAVAMDMEAPLVRS